MRRFNFTWHRIDMFDQTIGDKYLLCGSNACDLLEHDIAFYMK